MLHGRPVEIPQPCGDWSVETIPCSGANLVGWVVVAGIDFRYRAQPTPFPYPTLSNRCRSLDCASASTVSLSGQIIIYPTAFPC